MTFRRFLAISLLTFCLGSAAIIGLFLHRFDIDLYRPEIEAEIARRANLPLRLGKVSFSLRHGPAIAFDAVEAGSPDSSLQITARSLYLRLRLLPMIRGRVAFSEILLETPDMLYTVPDKLPSADTAAATTPPATPLQEIGELFRSIRITDGTFRFRDRRIPAAPFDFSLENLDLAIDDLSLNAPTAVTLSGEMQCNQVRSPLSARGTVVPDSELPGWKNADFALEVELHNFASDLVSAYLRRTSDDPFIRGHSDVTLRLTGVPAEGARFDAAASGRDLGLHLPGTRQMVLPLGRLGVAGTWQATTTGHRFTDLALLAGAFELSGSTEIDISGPLPRVDVRLASKPLELAALEQMLPFNLESARAPARISRGRLTLERLEASGTADQITGAEFPVGIRHLRLHVTDAEVLIGSTTMTGAALSLDWDGTRLLLDQLTGRLGDHDFSASARLTPSGQAATGISLRGDGRFRLDTPPKGSDAMLPKILDIPFSFELAPVADYGHELQLHLAPQGAPMRLAARWSHPAGEPDRLSIAFDEFQLAPLLALSPQLRALPLSGRITGHLSLAPSPDGWYPTATLRLRDATAPIPGPLPDLHGINGTVHLDGTRVYGTAIQAVLGHSPILVDAEIPDLRTPVTRLHVTAPAIQGRDLVFSSPTALLEDVDGRVVIEPGRVGLGPIHVTMAGGTDAEVNGSVSTPQGDVQLDIDARYGNIDEVIALWSDDAAAEPAETERATETVNEPATDAAKHGSLNLRVSAAQGEISGMPFSEATASISRHDDTLVIAPIRFRSGSGTGLGQVLLVHRDQGPPRLRISGNLADFDAPVIHQQLLKRTSIISGSLSADFHIEGDVGPRFLPTSYGAAIVQLRDGNLHRISWLSRVLTILNIYPLLTKGDSGPGLPYAKVNGTLTLRNGVISSQDLILKGDVMNLSLVGSHDLVTDRLDATLEAMPLRSVDQILTRVPVAGWLLTGENKALIVAHFRLTGSGNDPKVEAIPLESVSAPVLGIFKRLIGLPVKLVTDPGTVLQNR